MSSYSKDDIGSLNPSRFREGSGIRLGECWSNESTDTCRWFLQSVMNSSRFVPLCRLTLWWTFSLRSCEKRVACFFGVLFRLKFWYPKLCHTCLAGACREMSKFMCHVWCNLNNCSQGLWDYHGDDDDDDDGLPPPVTVRFTGIPYIDKHGILVVAVPGWKVWVVQLGISRPAS